jgi:hypothetical protein
MRPLVERPRSNWGRRNERSIGFHFSAGIDEPWNIRLSSERHQASNGLQFFGTAYYQPSWVQDVKFLTFMGEGRGVSGSYLGRKPLACCLSVPLSVKPFLMKINPRQAIYFVMRFQNQNCGTRTDAVARERPANKFTQQRIHTTHLEAVFSMQTM